MTKVKSIIPPASAGVITAVGQTTVKDAVLLMTKAQVGSILVRDGENIGIFTERDLLTRVVAKDRDPRNTTLAEVMTTPIKTCSPDDDIAAVVDLMVREHIRHTVVATEEKIIAILSLRDVVVRAIKDVQDLIMRHTVRPQDSTESLASQPQQEPSFEMLLETTGTDLATGMANDKHFTEALERFHQQSQRYSRELSVLVIKIGSLKAILQETEVKVAEKLIRDLSGTIQALCRRADMPARLSEDVFGFILPETVASGAVRLAKRMKQTISKISQTNPFDLTVGISIGIADTSSGAVSCGADLKKLALDAMSRAGKFSPDGIIVASSHVPEPPDESAA